MRIWLLECSSYCLHSICSVLIEVYDFEVESDLKVLGYCIDCHLCYITSIGLWGESNVLSVCFGDYRIVCVPGKYRTLRENLD
jgi:hypothetical protein